jgi:hypothetical protein
MPGRPVKATHRPHPHPTNTSIAATPVNASTGVFADEWVTCGTGYEAVAV